MGAPRGNKNAAGPHRTRAGISKKYVKTTRKYTRSSAWEHSRKKMWDSRKYASFKKKMGLKAHY